MNRKEDRITKEKEYKNITNKLLQSNCNTQYYSYDENSNNYNRFHIFSDEEVYCYENQMNNLIHEKEEDVEILMEERNRQSITSEESMNFTDSDNMYSTYSDEISITPIEYTIQNPRNNLCSSLEKWLQNDKLEDNSCFLDISGTVSEYEKKKWHNNIENKLTIGNNPTEDGIESRPKANEIEKYIAITAKAKLTWKTRYNTHEMKINENHCMQYEIQNELTKQNAYKKDNDKGKEVSGQEVATKSNNRDEVKPKNCETSNSQTINVITEHNSEKLSREYDELDSRNEDSAESDSI